MAKSFKKPTPKKKTPKLEVPEGTKKSDALDMALAQIEKVCGQGAIMKLGANPTGFEINGIETGSLSLDIALGGKGVPRGRVIEVFGPESSGKTTLSLHIIANAQKAGGSAAFIDAEHAFDPNYAKRLGVNLDELLVSQPDCGEQALEITEILVRSNAVDIVVVDSVAALVPRAELEGDMGDAHVGLQARLMSQALRKLTHAASKSDTAILFINQLREKIGVMFGSPLTTPGGRALKFYASIRIDIRRIGALKEGDRVLGNRTLVKVVKNKVAPPFKQAEFDIVYNRGISYLGDLIDLGVQLGLVQKSGSWLAYGDTKLGQGREKAKVFLFENDDIKVELEQKIKQLAGVIPSDDPVEDEAPVPAESA